MKFSDKTFKKLQKILALNDILNSTKNSLNNIQNNLVEHQNDKNKTEDNINYLITDLNVFLNTLNNLNDLNLLYVITTTQYQLILDIYKIYKNCVFILNNVNYKTKQDEQFKDLMLYNVKEKLAQFKEFLERK